MSINAKNITICDECKKPVNTDDIILKNMPLIDENLRLIKSFWYDFNFCSENCLVKWISRIHE